MQTKTLIIITVPTYIVTKKYPLAHNRNKSQSKKGSDFVADFVVIRVGIITVGKKLCSNKVLT